MTDRYLQVSKCAKILDCSREFIYQLIRDKKLAAINLNSRATRISERSLRDFIKKSAVDPGKIFSL